LTGQRLGSEQAAGVSDLLRTTHAILTTAPPLVHHVVPGLPSELGLIVAKCLQINASDRYASIHSLLHDLRAIQALVDGSSPDHFEVGKVDRQSKFRLPPTQVGVEDARLLLSAALAQAAQGSSPIASVRGPSGKTALIQSLRPQIEQQGGGLFVGKYDVAASNRPLVAIGQIFEQLISPLLALPEDALVESRDMILKSCGSEFLASFKSLLSRELLSALGLDPVEVSLHPQKNQEPMPASFQLACKAGQLSSWAH
jgi:hypothetical protein